MLGALTLKVNAFFEASAYKIKKRGEAGFLPAPPQLVKTKKSHPKLEDMEHKIQCEAGVIPAPPQSLRTKTSHPEL